MQVKIRFCELLFVEECFHEEKCGYSLPHNTQPLNHEAFVCPQDTHATGIRGHTVPPLVPERKRPSKSIRDPEYGISE